MNLVIAHSAQIAFAVSRALNCTDRTENGDYTNDTGSIGWGFLGCCIPIVGLVLFLVWKDTKPRNAKAAGIGALVCVIAYVLMYVAAAVLGISAAVYAY